MTANEIAQLIENPSLCKTENLVELEKLATKYPYAQTFPIIHLLHLGRTKSLDFEEVLSKNAYKISDRTHLYFQINEDTAVIADTKKTTEHQKTAPEVTSTLSISMEEETHVSETKPHPPFSSTDSEKLVLDDDTPVHESPEVGLRAEIDIDPEEDMSDFAIVAVEEMTFEPVTIDFDDSDFVPVLLDEQTPLAISPAEEISDSIESSLHDLEIEKNDTQANKNIETRVELDPDGSTPPEFVERETLAEATVTKVEFSSSAEVAPVSEKETEDIPNTPPEIRTENDLAEEEHSENFDQKSDEIQNQPSEVIHALTPSEDAIEPVRSLTEFDPTIDLFAGDQIAENTNHESDKKEIEKPTVHFSGVAKQNDPIEDELTSQALAQGFDIRQTIDTITSSDSREETETSAEETTTFEQTSHAREKSFTAWLKSSTNTQSPEYQVKQQRTEEILERFIKEDPKITRISKLDEPEKKAAEFFKVSRIAKESLNEKVMPVSETLAQIFEEQGNFAKAIEAYKQLMLFNPEKKSFFANQIKKLKHKQ